MTTRIIASSVPHMARAGLAAAALALAAALAGCAGGPAAATAASPAGPTAPLIAAPPVSLGAWHDLGEFMAPWLAGDAPVPVAGPAAPTRVAGLQREDGSWLAIVLVQVAPSGAAPCPASTGLHVLQNSGGCLRMRRDADFDHWLEQQHAVLYHWLDGRGWGHRPRAWVSYRAPSSGVEAHALLDTTLIEPTTRNNADFLAGGQPGLDWAQRFAAATTAAAGGGALAVPAFPFAPQVAAAEAPPAPALAPASAAAAGVPRATQVTPARPPAPAPRRDRQ